MLSSACAGVVRNGRISSWSAFLAEAGTLREGLLSKKGAGFRILTQAEIEALKTKVKMD